MSDPTDLYFCVSVGFGTNHRKLKLERMIGERANFIPQTLWSYAALNQRDGNFSTYTDADFQQIFRSWGLRLKLSTAKRIVAGLKAVGFIDPKGRLHSWRKFNDFFYSSHQRRAARAKWRKERQKEREERDAKAKAEAATKGNGSKEAPLFRQIESTKEVIAQRKGDLAKIKVPSDVWDEERKKMVPHKERETVLTRRMPIVQEIADLETKLKRLHEQQAKV